MDNYRVIELKQSVFADNDADADLLRSDLAAKGIFLINLMSSPGSGKTSLLSRLIPALADRYRIGVMEADIDSAVDAEAIMGACERVIQLHTGGMCHLDAEMTRQGLSELGADDLDLVFLENVGNLVCPAEFDTGASINMAILSVPEGDDKPLKYPLMFEVCDVLVISKVDVMPYFDFDLKKAADNAGFRNPAIKIFPVSAKTGEGIGELAAWLRDMMPGKKEACACDTRGKEEPV